MHVVHILSGDLWGGAETQVYTLVRGLRAADGVSVTVLLFNDDLTASRLRECGVAVNILDESRHGPVALVARLAQWLRQTQPDVVHTHGYKECVIGTLAAWFGGRVTCVRTVHGWSESHPHFWQLKKRLARIAERIVLSGQRAIIAVSAELGERLLRYIKHNVVVIENGVDVAAIEAAAGWTPEASRDRSWRIGIVGRLVPVKRIDIFVDTCRLLRDEFGDQFRAVVVGEGPCVGDVRSQIRHLGLETEIELAGFVLDVPRAINGLNAVLITSDHEGLPMTLLEAMTLKIPVVAHAVGGIPTALDQGACGWLVHEQDARCYYAAVREVLIDVAEAKRRVDRAYERVTSIYSVARVAHQYKELYQRIVNGRRG